MEHNMVVLSTTRVRKASDTYKIVDALNRTLKHQDLIFGLSLDKKDEDTMVFTIYRA
ncbi:YpmA family protein [Alkalihalobacillus sp. MEB130]|uniref:YpmA family protein n=1 Tax=Alkalihalobacillus sp. MEB130 TaxID=2976704 RepID=UPI0028DFA096|nr:YpmA family protein [Alkalihalobacillus sp. MEB130]MDT8859975.1 YpmA family protein [Alkalihalobacillus sp. MEB130]